MWKKWYGKPKDATRVCVRLRNGDIDYGKASDFRWNHSVSEWGDEHYYDIIEYRELGAPGEWIIWNALANKPDLNDLLYVEVQFRSGVEDYGKVKGWDWTHNGGFSDIVAYRLVEDSE